MTKTDYNASIRRVRGYTNDTMSAVEQDILRALRRAYQDLTELMGLSGTGKVTYAVYSNKRAEIAKVMDQMTLDINMSSRLAIKAVAEDTIDIYGNLTSKYAKEKGYAFDAAAAFNSIPYAAVQNVVGRVWGDGYNFSDRIWIMNEYANQSVKDILSAGISRGEGATKIAKQLQEFLIEPSISDTTSYTTAGLKSITGRGTINYNALRLAKNEINNTYREALVVANDKNPIMGGVKWNLSGSHPRPDICDVWAKMDAYGLGAGVTPADKTPIDHVGGFCFLTEVIRPPAEWGQTKEDPEPVAVSQTDVSAIVKGEGVTPGMQIAAFKMWNATATLVEKSAIRKAA